MYNRIILAVGYFVNKHDMKRLYMLKHFNKNHRPENIVIYLNVRQQGLDWYIINYNHNTVFL